MILQALYDYYHRCDGLPQKGLELKEIGFLIVIDKNGHFLRFEDVIDYAKSKIMGNFDGTQTVMVPSLKRSLIKDKHLFCIDAIGNVIISDTLRKVLKKNGISKGLSFSKSCVSEDE